MIVMEKKELKVHKWKGDKTRPGDQKGDNRPTHWGTTLEQKDRLLVLWDS